MIPLDFEAAVRWIDRFFGPGRRSAHGATSVVGDDSRDVPTVLCVSPYSAWWVHAAWEHTLLRAMVEKGARVHLVGCDGLGDTCDMRSLAKPASPGQCGSCQLQALLHARGFGFTPEWISRFVSPEQRASAIEWSRTLPANALEDAVWMDVAIGRCIRSSVFTYLRASRICLDDPQTQEIYRQYLAAAAVQAIGVAAAINTFRPAVVLVFNGRMSLTRVTLEVAKACGIPVFCHERGATKNTMTLWAGEHCTAFQKTRVASIRNADVPLNASQADVATKWVRDRRIGRDLNWDDFLRNRQRARSRGVHPDPDNPVGRKARFLLCLPQCAGHSLGETGEIVARMLPREIVVPGVEQHSLAARGINDHAGTEFFAVAAADNESSHRVGAVVETQRECHPRNLTLAPPRLKAQFG
jgi:hypothetical protein